MPCYDIPGNPPPYYPQGIGSCGDIDLDFGASPNLFRIGGRKLVGAGQKSGVYHVFDAKTMKPVWTQVVGPPSAVGGIVGSTAFDGGAVYGPVTVPGYLWSLSRARRARCAGPPRSATACTGATRSRSPTGSSTRRPSTASSTPMTRETGSAAGAASRCRRPRWAGVSVARNTVYAAVGIRGQSEGFIVAFRLGGTTAAVAVAAVAVVAVAAAAVAAAAARGSNPPIVAGARRRLERLRDAGRQRRGRRRALLQQPRRRPARRHRRRARAATAAPLFSTPLIGLGETAPVRGPRPGQSRARPTGSSAPSTRACAGSSRFGEAAFGAAAARCVDRCLLAAAAGRRRRRSTAPTRTTA